MSRFFGEMTGIGTTAMHGTNGTGLEAVVRTWEIGVAVEGSFSDDDGSAIRVYATGGSNNPHNQVLLATLAQGSDGYTIEMEDAGTVTGIISTIDQEPPSAT